MRGKSHLITGLTTGVATAVFTFSGNIVPSLVLVGTSVAASIAPDIDLPTSTLGRKTKPISTIINKLFGHRTITHAPLWLIPLFILYFSVSKTDFQISPFIISNVCGMIIGQISGFTCHLLGDMFTAGGIPVFYPFKSKRIRLSKVESGKFDFIIIILVTLIYIIFWYLMKRYILS